MRRTDFHYDLPEELIAQQPLEKRVSSRLLDASGDEPVDRTFGDICDLLRPEDLLVFNDTRVIKARLFGKKDTGGKVEILLERLIDARTAVAHVRASKRPKPGGKILVDDQFELVVGEPQGDLLELRSPQVEFSELTEACGHVPLPPYIAREDVEQDLDRYQTVYARSPGAVAAPTAGLHFDDEILNRIREKGVRTAFATLHVGAGTFQPVRVDDLDQHVMHEEWLNVDQSLVDAVEETRSRGGRVVAVGTTAVRSLETAARDGELKPYTGDTQLFIRPGYQFRVVDALLTNFHLPESTLIMLVCAFAGYDHVMNAYRHAVTQGYRFFSYGDAMWLERRSDNN